MYISVVTVHVKDIDRAVDFYTKKLGWVKTMDVPMGESRWVTVAPSDKEKTSFVLSNYSPEEAGGFSGVIIEVDDVFATHEQLSKAGVEFEEAPRIEPWGGWAQFKDADGNLHGLHSPVPAKVGA
jgi:predicted enzyme related to lactoylglutathione lyase